MRWSDMRAIETRRWTREEYNRMAAEGYFGPEERVELLDGEILIVPRQGSRHATAIHLAAKTLSAAFGSGFYVRIQGALALEELSEPEPDVAVVRGTERDYATAHPSTALLVVEVSDSTLEHDRERKGSIYARTGIPEYWILNLIDRRLEVYRDPDGSEYRSVTNHAVGESVSPLHAAAARVTVADLLP
jgi:Uma2 family endonuclease